MGLKTLMIRVSTIMYTPINIILFLILMVIGLNGEIMDRTWEDTQEFRDIQLKAANLAFPAKETDALFKTMGYGAAGDFLTNVMGQESTYGYQYKPEATHTMTQAQIDPILYHELLEDIANYPGWAKRAKTVNKYMQTKPGYKDWDITKLADVDVQPKNVVPYAPGTGHVPYAVTSDNFDFSYNNISPYTQDPITAFMLSRLMLTKDKKPIPVGPEEQASRWDSFWNRNPAPGTGQEEFLNKLNTFRPVEATMNNYNKTKF